MTIEEALRLGLQHHRAGRLADAEKVYRQILGAAPDHPQALHLLGMVARRAGHPDAAMELIRRAISIDPDNPDFHGNLGLVLLDKQQFAEAIPVLQKAIALRPAYAEAHCNLGTALAEMQQFDEAVEAFQTAIRIHPDFFQAYSNLAGVLGKQRQYGPAIAALQSALRLNSTVADLHYNLGLTHLLLGNYEQGWAEHEWRLKSETLWRPREMDQPRWQGEPLEGRTILLHSEQGLGDTLQFVRYTPLVSARGGQVVLECQPAVHSLLVNMPGISRVIMRGQPVPDFSLQCPLMSLPFALGSEPIPAEIPYLFAEPAISESWKRKLRHLSPGRKIGLVWAGSPIHKNDRNRSMRLDQLSPLAAIEGVHLISLQKGRAADQPASSAFAQTLIDYTAELHDFADTAGLIANLDLVISVDTSVAHLAGGMGKPVWLLLPVDPDWRWLLEREDSPWYPTMRLFRQTEAGNWAEVIARVATLLRSTDGL